jgi:hypothetical protein
LLGATLYQASIKPPLGTINVVDYLLGATLYQASIKPPLGTIDVVDYLLGATLYQASIKPSLGTIDAVDYLFPLSRKSSKEPQNLKYRINFYSICRCCWNIATPKWKVPKWIYRSSSYI